MFSAPYSFPHAIIGGVLIGLGSFLVMLATGRPLGISGMFSRSLFPRTGDWAWRLVFFLGLLAGAALAFRVWESAGSYRPVCSRLALGIAGVLVGFGTRVGGGCTSGHGVCGISLGSKSALVATLLFIGAGMLTVFALRHVGAGFFSP